MFFHMSYIDGYPNPLSLEQYLLSLQQHQKGLINYLVAHLQ